MWAGCYCNYIASKVIKHFQLPMEMLTSDNRRLHNGHCNSNVLFKRMAEWFQHDISLLRLMVVSCMAKESRINACPIIKMRLL